MKKTGRRKKVLEELTRRTTQILSAVEEKEIELGHILGVQGLRKERSAGDLWF